jgi:hypothetical protein
MSETPRKTLRQPGGDRRRGTRSEHDDLPLFAAAAKATLPLDSTHGAGTRVRQTSRPAARASDPDIVSQVRALSPELTGADLAEAKFVLDVSRRNRTLPVGCSKVAKALLRRAARSDREEATSRKAAEIVFLRLNHNQKLLAETIERIRGACPRKRAVVLNAEAKRLLKIAKARGEPASIAVPDVAFFLATVERMIASKFSNDRGHGGAA